MKQHVTHVWLHAAEQEAETVSVCSSESLADQGYAASEGMADSPTTSPEDTVSLGPEPYLSPTQPRDDCDSDEGCATWGSRYSGNLRPGNQPVNRKDITAQIHLTLADLDADLADEFNLSDETSVCVYDEIPVSVVDMDIPVTAIDEVIDDDPISQSSYEAELCCSSKQSIDLQNQNNNACMSKKASPSPTDPIQSGDKKEPTGTVTLKSPAIKPDKQTLLPEPSQSPAMATGTPSAQNAPDLRSASTVQSHRKETTKVDRVLSVKAQNMISQSTASKYGLKTFTVVPNKPVAPQNHNKSESSLRIGAIKIDEFGNMVTPRETRDKPDRIDKASDDRDCPLLDKAKAFWSSASNEDSAPTTYKRSSVTSEDVETSKTLSLTVPSQPAEKTSVTEPPKQVNGPSTDLASAVSKKLAVSDPAENIFFSEHRKNLTFLKPSRRTSSQYVASAITKYTASSSDKVDEVKESQESTSDGQMKLTYHAFKNGPRPVQAASNHKVSTASENSVPFPAAKLHSSYPAEKQELSKEAQIIGAVVTGIKTRNSSSGNIKPLQQAWVSSCSEPTQSSTKECKPITMTTGNPLPLNITVNTSRPAVAKKPEIHILGLQPSPFGPVRKFKSVVPKLVEKETSLHSSLMDAIQSGNGMERLQKVCNSSKADMFKKPENERSALLSALRAENTSARLKKTSSSAAAELEKFRKSEETRTNRRYTTSTTPAALKISPSFTPPPPNFTSPPPNFTSPPPPLNFTSPPPPPNFTSPPPPPNFTSPPPPPNFTSPPPPPNFTSPPAPPPPNFIPPPPPTTPFSKPTVILPVGGNSECPREAMLEAIRSGAGAERLRKVPVSVKTVKVNGRLGTILAPASPPPQP